MIRITVNGRELVRPVMTSLGYILCRVLPLLEKHFEVDVVTPRGPLNENALDLFKKRNLRRIETSSDCLGIRGRLTFYLALYTYVRDSQADWFWEINHVLAPVPRRTRTAVTIHDLYPLHPDLNKSLVKAWVFRLSLMISVRLASLVMIPSQTTCAELHARIGRPRGREAVLPNGAWSELPRARLRGRWTPGTAILGYIGRVNYWKGVDLLLSHTAACDRVSHLLLAGALDKPFLDDICAQKTDILSKVKILGPISEELKVALFEEIDIFAYETRYDGFGIPPLEAMINRIPVIVSDIPIMREVLGPYAIYLRTNVSDPIGLAVEQLESLDDADFISFLDAAQAHAQKFSWEIYAEKMVQLLMIDEHVA